MHPILVSVVVVAPWLPLQSVLLVSLTQRAMVVDSWLLMAFFLPVGSEEVSDVLGYVAWIVSSPLGEGLSHSQSCVLGSFPFLTLFWEVISRFALVSLHSWHSTVCSFMMSCLGLIFQVVSYLIWGR